MAQVGLPLTGAGDATAIVATDQIGGEHYQRVKLFDATEGSTVAIAAKATTPGAADGAMVVRPIGSTAFPQAVVGAVGLTSGSSAVELTSAGSTRLVGRFTLENPTTSVSLSSVHTVTVGNPTTAVEANLSSVGSTKLVGKVDVNNPTTAVEANLSSLGSSRLVGRVDVNNPTTAVSLSSQHTVTVGNPTTAVNVTSGVVLGAGSSGNLLGAVAVSSGVVLGAGSSANVLGAVAQGPGSSANHWFSQPLPFSSANAARTTVNTSADVSVIAANANRKALLIANLSTAQTVALGMTTAAVTTGLVGVSIYLGPLSQLTFGYSGGMPLFTGPFRGINITSTAVAGGVAVTEFT